ncbi:uncharacterized protein A1O9_09021 [Exophiala aquamarina CBS 119918]|uniref:L-ornithine N(5)-oxygenase n=1 Tax=Exophiala aquamarina CBS 119918 TaxID=1182545 RepID=A0A072P377_9EURO|nr:uncharacterized protein A1O9_09021 [Exophiala aquamarina CBS 119918]KEF54579.1 hypothetical protein A1O9_09021 [Exophiala aquamarina CBS 119918]
MTMLHDASASSSPAVSNELHSSKKSDGDIVNPNSAGVLLSRPTDSELIAKRISESVQESQYYKNYKSDYKISTSLLADPLTANRKIRILNVGAGLFSINLAYYFSTLCENFDLTLVEKSSRLGGVWNHNQYPGIACDIPSHVYQYSWAPNPEWPRFLSSGEHIRAYLEKVCDTFDLKKYMRFNTEVIKAEWIPDGFWRVTMHERQRDGNCIEFTQEAEILVNNSGTQHKYQWPNVEGLERFSGKLLHTAMWDSAVVPAACKGKTVAVIGSGASAVQVVPQLQSHAEEILVFSRTPIWFAPGLAGDGFSPEYSPEQRDQFKRDPAKLVNHAKEIERKLNSLFPALFHGSDAQKKAIAFFHDQMKKKIHDPELLKGSIRLHTQRSVLACSNCRSIGFTPDFAPGCRRITPADYFIHAVQQPNAKVIFKSVNSLTQNGILDEDGAERNADIIVCATGTLFDTFLLPKSMIMTAGLTITQGFNVDFIPPFEVYGRDRVSLADIFAEKQDNYMGIAVPGFPNMFCGSGPYWTTANGSLEDPMNTSSRYIVQVAKKLQMEHNIVGIDPTDEALADWVEHAQAWVKGMVWSGDCKSWYKIYKGPYAGRTNALWPGITLHMVKALKTPRWEDYRIDRKLSSPSHANRFQYLGHGMVQEVIDSRLDDTPHFSLSEIDPRWAKATGMTWVPGMRPFSEEQANSVH